MNMQAFKGDLPSCFGLKASKDCGDCEYRGVCQFVRRNFVPKNVVFNFLNEIERIAKS